MKPEIKQFYKEHSANSTSLSEDAELRVKEKVFSNLGTQLAPEPVSVWSKILRGVKSVLLRGYVLVPLVVVLFVTGTTIASANALPGDTLYPVKRQVENARIFLAPTEEAKLELEVNFAKKRLEEAEKVSKTDNDSQATSASKNSRREENSALSKDRNDSADDTKDEFRKSENNSKSEDKFKKFEERRQKINEDTNKALEFLNKAREDWQKNGNDERAGKIEDRIKRFENNFKERSDWGKDFKSKDRRGSFNSGSGRSGSDDNDNRDR